MIPWKLIASSISYCRYSEFGGKFTLFFQDTKTKSEKTRAEANDFRKGQGEKVSAPRGKSFFSSENFMFQALEHKFQALEHISQALEYKFQALVYKKVLEGKRFSPREKNR